MTAFGMKQWTAAQGDYLHVDDVDYNKKYTEAKNDLRQYQKKVIVSLGVIAFGLLILVLELSKGM